MITIRTEQEMMDLVLNVASTDERIRAVGMEGSRTNPNVPNDIFQDYDIVYFVNDMQSFIENPEWVDVFGKRIIMQTPENSELFPPELDGNFSYLMLFTDGNRIDLTICPITYIDKWVTLDKLVKVLLDKDGLIPTLPDPTDRNYWVKKPSQKSFEDCCNEFWWVSTYVAKGLWRNEILYAHDHLQLVRKMLLQMIEWKVGVETNFSVSIGKNGKYLDRYLDDKTWYELLKTYPTAETNEIWKALQMMTALFDEVSLEVANQSQFNYPPFDTSIVKAYLEHVSHLPADAKEIY